MVTHWEMQPSKTIKTKKIPEREKIAREGVVVHQFGMRAFSGPLNIVPTFVACSRDE